MNNLVSIIIPLYNVEHYVSSSLKSALNQTVENIEYILVDDCSTDQTMSIVNKIIAESTHCNRVKIVRHQKNRGLSAARNTGMECANGDFIFFMDSDDEITPDCIEKHYNALQKTDADFTIANVRLEGAKSVHIKPISDEIERVPLRMSYFKRMWSISAWNKLYRKKFLRENKLTFQEGLLHEDILWSYQVVAKARKAALVTEMTYIYKVRENSITTRKNGSRKIESLLFILRFIDNDKKSNIPGDFLNAYYCMFDFWRLNTALLLLNYDGASEDAREYYSQLKGLRHKRYRNIYSLILNVPLAVFKTIGTVAYKIYKRS